MDFYRILPITVQQIDAPFYLVIAQYMDEKTTKYYRKRMAEGATVILDNGAFEFGKAMDEVEYVNIINDLKPTVIVCPDEFGNGTKSRERTVEFLLNEATSIDIRGYVSERKMRGPEYMGVIWANNMREWIYNYDEVGPRVNRIAIPKMIFADVPNGRIPLTYMLPKMDKPFHMLGMNSVNEAISINHNVVKSVDTALAAKFALVGINMEKHYEIYGDCVDDPGVFGRNFSFQVEMSPSQQRLMWSNQIWLENIINIPLNNEVT